MILGDVSPLCDSGEEFDPSEATRRYFDGLKYPIMVRVYSVSAHQTFRFSFLIPCRFHG